MNKETLKRANKISNVIDALYSLNSIMSAPYPKFEGTDRNELNSARFDEETLMQLKNVVKTFVETRISELQNEFEQL